MIEYHPLILLRVFTTGTNQPLLCRTIGNNGAKEDLVIKLKSGERMDEGAFLREYMASKLAQALSLKTPEPYLATKSRNTLEAKTDRWSIRT